MINKTFAQTLPTAKIVQFLANSRFFFSYIFSNEVVPPSTQAALERISSADQKQNSL